MYGSAVCLHAAVSTYITRLFAYNKLDEYCVCRCRSGVKSIDESLSVDKGRVGRRRVYRNGAAAELVSTYSVGLKKCSRPADE